MVIVFILSYSWNDDHVHNRNMIFTKILITNFSKFQFSYRDSVGINLD